jgi:hypothetical protein
VLTAHRNILVRSSGKRRRRCKYLCVDGFPFSYFTHVAIDDHQRVGRVKGQRATVSFFRNVRTASSAEALYSVVASAFRGPPSRAAPQRSNP